MVCVLGEVSSFPGRCLSDAFSLEGFLSALAAAEAARREIDEKQKELDDISLAAAEAREQAELAAKEAKRQAFERTKSRKKRQVEASEKERTAKSVD